MVETDDGRRNVEPVVHFGQRGGLSVLFVPSIRDQFGLHDWLGNVGLGQGHPLPRRRSGL